MTASEAPAIYISPSFYNVAVSKGVIGIQGAPPAIAEVLELTHERYATDKLPTALGAIMLIAPEDNPDESHVRAVLPQEQSNTLAVADRFMPAGEALSRASGSLVIPDAVLSEGELSWGLSAAAEAAAQQSGKVGPTLNPLFMLGALLTNASNAVWSSGSKLMREHNQSRIRALRPIQLTWRS